METATPGQHDDAPPPPQQQPTYYYHERQRWQQCLRHAINNLLQAPRFDAPALDAAADALGPGVAARNRFPLLPSGNWDANVLAAALAPLGLEVVWHDKRDAALERLDLSASSGSKEAGGGELVGLIVNVRARGWLAARLLGGRHWFAIRRLDGAWHNLDSRLPAPAPFASGGGDGGESGSNGNGRDDGTAALRAFLCKVLAEEDGQVLRVVRGVAAAAAAAPRPEECTLQDRGFNGGGGGGEEG